MNILASDLYPDKQWAQELNAQYVDIPTICREADFITLHASGGEMLLGENEINMMRPTTALINCARGVLVDNTAVYQAVKEGRLYGYGIDEVWEYEDLPLEGLNIVTSPHVGSDTDMGKANMQLMSAQALIDFSDGKEPQFIVNRR
jgi:D-3-phosphoglycerate dehydrogenase